MTVKDDAETVAVVVLGTPISGILLAKVPAGVLTCMPPVAALIYMRGCRRRRRYIAEVADARAGAVVCDAVTVRLEEETRAMSVGAPVAKLCSLLWSGI